LVLWFEIETAHFNERMKKSYKSLPQEDGNGYDHEVLGV
jgi:hypothetical protein